VVGGTGRLGSQVVAELEGRGHETVAAAPSTDFDTISGAGVAEGVAGAQVVVDVSNAPSTIAAMDGRDSSLPVPWSQLQAALKPDGSLRDIVVLDTTMEDWERAYRFVRGLFTSGDARLVPDPDPLPKSILDVFALTASDTMPKLGIHLGDVRLNCHFFGEREIEFDVWPSDVSTEARAELLLTFMDGLATAVGRPVHLTEENVHEWRWLTFDPGTGAWTTHPAPISGPWRTLSDHGDLGPESRETRRPPN
jgi:hypothetical protein